MTDILLILFLGCYIVWIWVILPTFRKYIPPPSSGSKCVRLVRLRVYIGSCFEKQRRWGGTVGIGASFA
jgi:hypothetical protein